MEEKKNIILIDDESMNSYLLNMIIENNYDVIVHICSCTNDAMVILHRYKIDLILSDIMMPNVDGFDFAYYLSQHNDYKNIPVIFVSAIDINKTTSEKIKASGAKGIIQKPLNVQTVTEVLNDYLT